MSGENLTDLSAFEEIDIRDPNLPDRAMALFFSELPNVDNSSNLTFDKIESTDFGSYVCVANLNNESSLNLTFSLINFSFDLSDISVLTG